MRFSREPIIELIISSLLTNRIFSLKGDPSNSETGVFIHLQIPSHFFNVKKKILVYFIDWRVFAGFISGFSIIILGCSSY